MRRITLIAAVVLGYLACSLSASAQSGTYTQAAQVMCRSGELNCIAVPLLDSSGNTVGDYTLECNSNAINNITCHFTLILNGITYTGKVTQVTTYFPFPPGYHGSNGGPGPFAYNWSATGNGVTLTGSHQGQGHWGSGGCHTCGYAAFIDSSTVTVN